MEYDPSRITINVELLKFAAYLGLKYKARVISWGRDLQGNRDAGSKDDKSWHRWIQGANAVDMKVQNPQNLPAMAEEAIDRGYHVEVYRTSMHFEVNW